MNLKKKIYRDHNAQGILEYILLVGIVVVAVMVMTQAIKRGTQSIIKTTADQIGVQEEADQKFSRTGGYLNNINSSVYEEKEKQLVERVGVIRYVQNDIQYLNTISLTNMGFSEEE